MKRLRANVPRENNPISTKIGLWKQLDEAHRKQLTKLGFDKDSWNNNVKEKFSTTDFDIFLAGDVTHSMPYRYEIMVGDRAREPVDDLVAYER